MANFKRIAAMAAAAAMLSSMAACGSNTAYALTIDGEQIKAGIYIYYSYLAYNDAVQTIASQDSEIDTSDKEVVKKQKIDGKDAYDWIQDKALSYCKEQAAINKEFKAANLTLPEETQTELDTTMETFWEQNKENFMKNGISESSIYDIMEYTYNANEVFYYYYGIGGADGVTEKEVHKYYVENTARTQYVAFNAVDGVGEALEGSAKTKFEKMVDGYLAAVKKLDESDEIEEKMNSIQEEYNAYVTSVSEEAAATATVTNEAGETVTVTTTTTAETTTSEGETTTTTTTIPYANEALIPKVTTDEDTKEEDLTYTPNKTVYDYIFDKAKINEPDVVYDEESNTYYLVVRYDMEDRMTADDVWTEQLQRGVVSAMYSKDFQDRLDKWVESLDVKTNDAALKRYNPFELKFENEQNTGA